MDSKASAGSKLGRRGIEALSKEGLKPPNPPPMLRRGIADLSKGGRFFGGGLPPTEGRRGMAMFKLGGGPCGRGFFFFGIAMSMSIGGGEFKGGGGFRLGMLQESRLLPLLLPLPSMVDVFYR
jgi:hypothetical protein